MQKNVWLLLFVQIIDKVHSLCRKALQEIFVCPILVQSVNPNMHFTPVWMRRLSGSVGRTPISRSSCPKCLQGLPVCHFELEMLSGLPRWRWWSTIILPNKGDVIENLFLEGLNNVWKVGNCLTLVGKQSVVCFQSLWNGSQDLLGFGTPDRFCCA